jgi:hypothetical protein
MNFGKFSLRPVSLAHSPERLNIRLYRFIGHAASDQATTV